MRVRAGGEVRAHERRPLPRIVERAREAGVLLDLEVRQEERQDERDRQTAAATRSRSRTRATSTAGATTREERGVADRQPGRDAVVRAGQGLRRERRAPSATPRAGDGASTSRWNSSRQSGMPRDISSWMCAVWEKTYGQNAKSTAAVAAAAPSPVSRRASSHVQTTDGGEARTARPSCARRTGCASRPRPAPRACRRRYWLRRTRARAGAGRRCWRRRDPLGLVVERVRDPGDVPDARSGRRRSSACDRGGRGPRRAATSSRRREQRRQARAIATPGLDAGERGDAACQSDRPFFVRVYR